MTNILSNLYHPFSKQFCGCALNFPFCFEPSTVFFCFFQAQKLLLVCDIVIDEVSHCKFFSCMGLLVG
jgi:hypothetical protein